MTEYAIKIGEIHLRSTQPITEEQRRRAVRELADHDRGVITSEGLAVVDVLAKNR